MALVALLNPAHHTFKFLVQVELAELDGDGPILIPRRGNALLEEGLGDHLAFEGCRQPAELGGVRPRELFGFGGN